MLETKSTHNIHVKDQNSNLPKKKKFIPLKKTQLNSVPY